MTGWFVMRHPAIVIASAAKQSGSCRTTKSGLLRCARNDGDGAGPGRGVLAAWLLSGAVYGPVAMSSSSGIPPSGIQPSSLRAQRSNPVLAAQQSLDCFAALAMTGDGAGPGRGVLAAWLLSGAVHGSCRHVILHRVSGHQASNHRHCERSEAIQFLPHNKVWIASLRSQ